MGCVVDSPLVFASAHVGPRCGFRKLDEQFRSVHSAACARGVCVRVLSRVGVCAKPKCGVSRELWENHGGLGGRPLSRTHVFDPSQDHHGRRGEVRGGFHGQFVVQRARGGPLGIDLGSWVEHRDEHPKKLGQGDGSNRRRHVVPSESFDGLGQPIVQQTELVRQKAADLCRTEAMGALQPIC